MKKHQTPSISIREYLSDYRQEVDQFLDLVLPDVEVKPSSIHEATRYSIFAGGKRIRPILAIATSEALGGKLADVLPFAAALEMVHTYSIIHDDLPAMDNDDVRRGKPALHKRFGEGVAILAGNALLTEGKSYSADDLQSIHELKTGALIHMAVYGAAILSSATPDRLEKLSDFGRNVGLAFQVVDDILDVEGTTAQLGKESGRDCEKQKATYPALFGLEKSKQMALELIEAAIAELDFLGARQERLVELAQFVSVRQF